MFSVLISRRAVSRRPHCVYLEKQNKIVCIIRSATRAALEGSPAGSFRLQRAPAAGDPQPQPPARPTTTSSRWDGLWGAQMCSLPTGLFPRDEAKRCSGCPPQSLPGQGQDQAPLERPELPISSSPEPASHPASQQRGLRPRLRCFPAVSVWGTFPMAGNSDRAALLPPNTGEPGVLSLPARTGATRTCDGSHITGMADRSLLFLL